MGGARPCGVGGDETADEKSTRALSAAVHMFACTTGPFLSPKRSWDARLEDEKVFASVS